MKIGDRVAYAEEPEALGLTEPDLYGTVAEPTPEEIAQGLHNDIGSDAVMVEWDDGERYFEDPDSLVLLDADS